VEQFALESGPFAEDPYPIFERLRREAPVFWHEGLQAYIVTRYADCRRIAEDAVNFYNSPDGNPPIPYVMQLAGANHARLRKLINPAFSPRGLANAVEPALVGIADEMIDRFIDRGRAELVDELAEPMATRVISLLLNVDRSREKWMVKTADEMLEAEANPANAELQKDYPEKLAALRAMFAARLAEERRSPSGNLITELVQAEQDGGKLSAEELLANTMILVVAGVETTKRLVSSLIYLLLSHPDQLRQVREDRALLKPAIEETLRLHSPNQPIMRFAQNEVEVGGLTMQPGTRLYGMRGAANRDPEVWPDPDRFDIHRFTAKGLPPHLSFGWGPHMCVGAYLSRRETTVAMDRLLDRTRDLRLDPDHEVRYIGFRNRGPKALHVLFERA